MRSRRFPVNDIGISKPYRIGIHPIKRFKYGEQAILLVTVECVPTNMEEITEIEKSLLGHH